MGSRGGWFEVLVVADDAGEFGAGISVEGAEDLAGLE
jgi:hypothetical protein